MSDERYELVVMNPAKPSEPITWSAELGSDNEFEDLDELVGWLPQVWSDLSQYVDEPGLLGIRPYGAEPWVRPEVLYHPNYGVVWRHEEAYWDVIDDIQAAMGEYAAQRR